MDTESTKQSLSPMALPIADAARLLSKTENHAITPEMIQRDLANGAPANADGTINLVHYAAWLSKEIVRGD